MIALQILRFTLVRSFMRRDRRNRARSGFLFSPQPFDEGEIPGNEEHAESRGDQHPPENRGSHHVLRAGAQNVMGTAVFWGMLVATALGVFLIPGNFSFVEGLGRKKKAAPSPISPVASHEGAH